MKKIFSLIVVFITVLAGSVVGEIAEITVECVQGLKPGTTDTVFAGHQLRFDITYTNGYRARQIPSNCYSLSSPDGATWSNIDFVLIDPPPPFFPPDSDFAPLTLDGEAWDGFSPDCFRVALSNPWSDWNSFCCVGFGPWWDWSYVVSYLTFYVDYQQIGKHIVLDSMQAVGCTWVWSQLELEDGYPINIRPDWGGPYEYYIALSCCNGTVGNADCSEDEAPDISDLTRVIDYLYISHTPLCCLEEADFDGSGDREPDISDLTFLVRHLYLDHPLLPECP